MLGTGGGLLRAAVAEDGARSASVAVMDFRKGLGRARTKLEQAGAVFLTFYSVLSKCSHHAGARV